MSYYDCVCDCCKREFKALKPTTKLCNKICKFIYMRQNHYKTKKRLTALVEKVNVEATTYKTQENNMNKFQIGERVMVDNPTPDNEQHGGLVGTIEDFWETFEEINGNTTRAVVYWVSWRSFLGDIVTHFCAFEERELTATVHGLRNTQRTA